MTADAQCAPLRVGSDTMWHAVCWVVDGRFHGPSPQIKSTPTMFAPPKAPSGRELSSECETEGERETNERAVAIWQAKKGMYRRLLHRFAEPPLGGSLGGDRYHVARRVLGGWRLFSREEQAPPLPRWMVGDAVVGRRLFGG